MSTPFAIVYKILLTMPLYFVEFIILLSFQKVNINFLKIGEPSGKRKEEETGVLHLGDKVDMIIHNVFHTSSDTVRPVLRVKKKGESL